MINIIKVQCPHCNISGQLMIPNMDTLIIGPCPECGNMVLIFAGKAIPLDKNVLAHASRDEAYTHIYNALEALIREKLDQLFALADTTAANQQQRAAATPPEAVSPQSRTIKTDRISSQEMKKFIEEELHLLDDADYFKTIFG